MILTIEQIKKNDNISTDEIKRDIADTQAEIDLDKTLLENYYKAPSRYRLEIMKAEVHTRERQEFIDKLNCILKYRGV